MQSIPFTIPDALTGCNLYLCARGRHVRAYTWLTLTRGSHFLKLPLTMLGDTPQEAVDRLAALASDARRDWLGGVSSHVHD